MRLPRPEPGFHARRIGVWPYQFFVPRGAPPSAGWPCIVFLHGVGENGTDGERHMKVGLPKVVRRRAATFPAVVVCPQNPGPWKFRDEREKLVLDALARTKRELPVDPDRVILTGLSQGGCSTFDLGAKYPKRWAALVVVCGAGRPADAPMLEGVPLWIFHGGRDPLIRPSGKHKFDKEGLGGRDMHGLIPGSKYTEFPRAGHAIWDRVYGSAKLWKWVFAQKRR